MTPFFLAEMLIHSLVKSTRIVFCDSFENDKLTLLPSYLNGSPQRKLRSVFCPLHQERTSPFDLYVGGLRCLKSRKPEDRLDRHRLWEIACVASMGH